MPTSREERYQHAPAGDQLEAILERALTAYHRDELHGGARWVGERIVDAELVPIAREAFLEADELPPEPSVGEDALCHYVRFQGTKNRFVR